MQQRPETTPRGEDAGAAPAVAGPRVTAVATRRSPVDLAHLAHLVDTSRLRVPLDRVVAVQDVATAFEHAGSGRLRGKVVVSLAAPA